jgi:sRNA-binding protein
LRASIAGVFRETKRRLSQQPTKAKGAGTTDVAATPPADEVEEVGESVTEVEADVVGDALGVKVGNPLDPVAFVEVKEPSSILKGGE